MTRDSKGIERRYACGGCVDGEKWRTPFYFPSDKEKQRPYTYPVWPGSLPKIEKPDGRMAATGERDE